MGVLDTPLPCGVPYMGIGYPTTLGGGGGGGGYWILLYGGIGSTTTTGMYPVEVPYAIPIIQGTPEGLVSE